MTTVRNFFFAFILLSTAYLLCSLLFLHEVSFYLKPFLLIPLMIVTFRATGFVNKIWLFLALSFSWMGDILLLFVFKDGLFFIFGLISFLIAHLFYIYLFIQEIRKAGGTIRLRQPEFTFIILFLVGFYGLVNSYLGALQVPVIIYAVVICFMLYIASLLFPYWSKPASFFILAGAISFVVSDFLLAINKFFAPFPNAGFFIMITYLFAQGALVWACLDAKKSHDTAAGEKLSLRSI